jgi:hypothetical protein
MNRLVLSGIDRGDECELVVLVDGWDVLAGLDAVGVDPDLGLALLDPTAAPCRVRIGRCECGDDGCGSVTFRLSFDGETVVWDRWESSFGDQLPETFRFNARRYERVWRAASDQRPWETPERRFARRVAATVDGELVAALAWRGLGFAEVVPARDGAIAVHLTASYGEARWSVYVVHDVSDDPYEVGTLLRRRGPSGWPEVYWCAETEAGAFQQPPMGGRWWQMWPPSDV